MCVSAAVLCFRLSLARRVVRAACFSKRPRAHVFFGFVVFFQFNDQLCSTPFEKGTFRRQSWCGVCVFVCLCMLCDVFVARGVGEKSQVAAAARRREKKKAGHRPGQCEEGRTKTKKILGCGRLRANTHTRARVGVSGERASSKELESRSPRSTRALSISS